MKKRNRVACARQQLMTKSHYQQIKGPD